MAKKKVAEKKLTEKPLKKIRSFNIDDKVYSGLMELLQNSGTQLNLSSLIDDFLRKLYVYLIEMEGLKEKWHSEIPFSNIIHECLSIEYFKDNNRKTRISNLFISFEASKQGMSIRQYLESNPELLLDEMNND